MKVCYKENIATSSQDWVCLLLGELKNPAMQEMIGY
jgi:hypothetical protein